MPPDVPEVTVTVLAPLPDESGPWRSIYDINDRGQVVGQAGNEPVLWEDGQPIPLWIEPDSNLAATHINDRGDIILDGYSEAYHGRAGRVSLLSSDVEDSVVDLNESGQALVGRGKINTGFCGCSLWQRYEIWQDGVSTALQLPRPPSDMQVLVRDLSDGGHVLGEIGRKQPFFDVNVWSGSGGLFLWHQGRVTELTTANAHATAVNRHGQVVGSEAEGIVVFLPSYTRGMLWSGGRATRLPLQPMDINDRGQVAGTLDVDGQRHAAVWENGRVTDLGTLGGDGSHAIAINERGQVLGRSQAADGTTHAFLWTSGRMVDLGRVGDVSGIYYALNDEGQAIGPRWTEPPVVPVISGVEPVMWTVHDDGDPGPVDPPPAQCFTATNQAHVAAGRATSWLVFTWAAGSGTYIGLSSQTTSLRDAASGAWEPVTAC